MTKIGLFNNAESMFEEVLGNSNEQYEHRFEVIDNPVFSNNLPSHLQSQESQEKETPTAIKKGDQIRTNVDGTLIQSKKTFSDKLDKLKANLKEEVLDEIDETFEQFMEEMGMGKKIEMKREQIKKKARGLPKKAPGCNCQ